MPNVNVMVEQELTSVEKDFYQMAVPRLAASATTTGFVLHRYFSLVKGGWVLVLRTE
jgi:hypothetical protein